MRTDLVLDALRMALALRQPGADFELVSQPTTARSAANRSSRQL